MFATRRNGWECWKSIHLDLCRCYLIQSWVNLDFAQEIAIDIATPHNSSRYTDDVAGNEDETLGKH
jgi:hypothetical protein